MQCHKDTNTFDYLPVSEKELKNLSEDKLLPVGDANNKKLPSYEEINHREIMSFFVKECVEDKMIRKQLFNILRCHDFMETYLNKLHELNLYPMCRKTPCFSYGDIRHFHRIYASNWRWNKMNLY